MIPTHLEETGSSLGLDLRLAKTFLLKKDFIEPVSSKASTLSPSTQHFMRGWGEDESIAGEAREKIRGCPSIQPFIETPL